MGPLWECTIAGVQIDMAEKEADHAMVIEDDLQQMDCSAAFVNEHMTRGDNAADAPFGQLPRAILEKPGDLETRWRLRSLPPHRPPP